MSSDALIQVELGRHGRDLEVLRGLVDGGVGSTAIRMRDAARSEGTTLFGVPM
jgi:hypothetical protein